MPLPTPILDDRRFQDIVDQAKTLIPHYCPEWTDHNVSDPGVTLIELFAWMTDMLLYRVNQVPDKLYVKFLELIGVRLDPPRAANAPMTFYLSAPQDTEITIPSGTETATIRTETNPAIIFTTEADLTIRPPQVRSAYTRSAARGEQSWIQHDLRQLELPGQKIAIFSSNPVPNDAFYLALEQNHSRHVLALVIDCELAGGAGVDPRNPPLEWQVWQGAATRWVRCAVEYDGTGGFNESGAVILHTPDMAEGEFQGQRAFWLRCRLTEAQSGPGGYRVSPDIEHISLEARGGTVRARQASTIENEVLGRSDGAPGQSFSLLHTPVLSRDRSQDVLIVDTPGFESESWTEVDDFADSGAEDRHFVLDSQDGTILLGPTILQPDGTVYRFGAVPPKGSTLRFARYQYGGGVGGNVPAGTITVLKSSIPYVARVVNREPAVGGRDAQSLDDAKLRAPQTLRTRSRAVTADDYEYLAREIAGVARACCITPGSQPPEPSDPKPGQIFVIVLPQVDAPDRAIPPEQLTLSAEIRAAVLTHLNERRLLGTSLEVRPPQYVWVSVQAVLRVPDRSDPGLVVEVQDLATNTLYHYLNPYVGGPNNDGWPFGRDLHLSEIYGLLQRVPYAEFVEEVRINIADPTNYGETRPAPPRLEIPRHAVICSGQHQVTVR